jgi:hypothetical protein
MSPAWCAQGPGDGSRAASTTWRQRPTHHIRPGSTRCWRRPASHRQAIAPSADGVGK